MESMIKTILLLGILSVLLIVIGGFIGGQQGLLVAFFFSLVMNVGAYFYSDKIALSMNGAKPLSEKEAPGLFTMVRELSHKMGIPMPKLYITPAKQANAFATGRDPKHASVAVTEGIMQILDKKELEGVLAHELSHVKNRDILIATIAAVLASAISFIANMGMWSGLSGSDDEDRGSIGPILAIASFIVVPIAASLIQMAISRQREFAADYSGAKAMGTGKPLATALVAIHDSTRHAPLNTSPAFSSLYIENPLGGFGSSMMKLFSTHPPVEERIKRLQNI